MSTRPDDWVHQGNLRVSYRVLEWMLQFPEGSRIVGHYEDKRFGGHDVVFIVEAAEIGATPPGGLRPDVTLTYSVVDGVPRRDGGWRT